MCSIEYLDVWIGLFTWIGDRTAAVVIPGPRTGTGWTGMAAKYCGGSRNAGVNIWDGPDVWIECIDSSWLLWDVGCCCGDERSDWEPGRSFLP